MKKVTLAVFMVLVLSAYVGTVDAGSTMDYLLSMVSYTGCFIVM